MADISEWSATAANNNSASPDGAPENMNPSGVNDTIRENMSAVRRQMQDAQWFDWGDTPSYATASTFTISGDVTSRYEVGRRIKCTDSSTLYGVITASSYSSPNTTVTVSLDSGSLSASLSAVALSILTESNDALPRKVVREGDIGTGLTVSGNTVNLDVSDLTAESTIDADSDYVAMYDASASATRKVTVSDLTAATAYNRTFTGLLWENDSTDATNDFSISAGSCWSDDGTTFLELASAQVKQMDATWASGTNAGALATGATAWAAGVSYHVFIGLSGGNVEIVVDSAIGGANAIANNGFTKLRRIFSFLTATGPALPVLRTYLLGGGDICAELNVPSIDVNNSGSTGGSLATLSCPTNTNLLVKVLASMVHNAAVYALVTSPMQANTTPSSSALTLETASSSQTPSTEICRRTDTSARIRYRTSATVTSFRLILQAYTDTRTA